MSMPLDIPWTACLWADQPGFATPADNAVIPADPADIVGGTWSRGSGSAIRWQTDIAGSGKPAFRFPLDPDVLHKTPSYSDTSKLTAVVVGRPTTLTGADLIDGIGRRLIDVSGGVWRMYAGSSVVTGTTADTSLHMFVGEFNAAGNETLSIDTVQVINAQSGSEHNGSLRIGSSANGEHQGSEVAFVGFIDRMLTQQEKDDLWAWYQLDYLGIGEPARSGMVKHPDGLGGYRLVPVRLYNGSSWEIYPVKFNNGSEWILTK